MHIPGLDETDNKLLAIIKNNARLSYSDIGEQLGISRVTVKDRMKNLERKGVIQGYYTDINSTCALEGIMFYLDIASTPEQYENMLEEICADNVIRQVYSVSGDCSIHAVGFASDSKNLQVYINRLRRNLKGLTSCSIKIVTSVIKDMDGGVEYERDRDEGNDTV